MTSPRSTDTKRSPSPVLPQQQQQHKLQLSQHRQHPAQQSVDGSDAVFAHPPPRQRPPLRSNLDLEPNPFEQSFSSTSHVSQSSIHRKHSEDSNGTASLHNDPARKSDQQQQDAQDSKLNVRSDASEQPAAKPILPGIASITSPADQSFSNWGMASSLRSGPLSPAMLTAPANQSSLSLGSFDSSFVRTGLTPDVSRTGLTPLIGGPVSFPPPSPNTAALFALVNGAASGAPLPAITPNTLNALTGVLNQSIQTLNAGAGVPVDPAQPHQPHSVPVAHLPGQSYDNDPQQRQQPPGQQDAGQGAAYAYQPESYPPAGESASHALNNAASALYLLSQQQNLRRQQQGQVAPSAVSAPPGGEPQQGLSSDSAVGKRTSKRKSTDTPVAPPPRGVKKAKATNGTPARTTRGGKRKVDEDADGDDDDEDDDDIYMEIGNFNAMTNGRQTMSQGVAGKGNSKKPETEEEKRRNFLERNRQAALKCRQRKKAWLQALQQKVEFLTTENERLTNALVSSREEIQRLSGMVVAQGGAPSALLNGDHMNSPVLTSPTSHAGSIGGPSQPVSMSVSLPVTNQNAVPVAAGGRGYGY